MKNDEKDGKRWKIMESDEERWKTMENYEKL